MRSYEDLGKRVVQAARMAVAVHLYESATQALSTGQQLAIGGAGPSRVGFPAAAGNSVRIGADESIKS